MALTKISTAMWNSVPHHDTHDFNVDDVLYVDVSANRVGIGTNNPDVQLHVKSSSDTFSQVRVEAGADGHDSSVAYSQAGIIKGISGYDDSADTVAIKYGTFSGSGIDINSSGNVGIGTTNPSSKLDISFSGGGDSIKSASTNSTSYNSSKFYNDNSKGWHDLVYGSAYSGGSLLNVGADGAIIYGNTTSGITTLGAFNLLFGTNNTERMRIDSSGNVGIGTDNPSAGIHVKHGSITTSSDYSSFLSNATAKIVANHSNEYGISIGYANASTDTIGIQSGNTGASRPLSLQPFGGNVGIGTTSPSNYYSGADNLVVYQASGEAGITVATASDTTGALYFADGTSGDTQYRGGIAYTHSSDLLSLVSGGASRMFIDNSGNVGIGESDPDKFAFATKELHIKAGTGASQSAMVAVNSSQSANGFIGGYAWINDSATNEFQKRVAQITVDADSGGADTSRIEFYTKNGAGNYDERMRIDASGVVRVGTIPAQSNATFSARRNGANIEFGHGNNTAGYYGTLGSWGSNGSSYIGFSCDNDDTLNTFTTRGSKGNIITGDTSGHLIFSQVTNANASGQTPIERMRINSDGLVFITTADSSAQLKLERTNTSTGSMYIGADNIGFKVFDSSFTPRLVVQSAGNVGIGTTMPGTKLDVVGDIRSSTRVLINTGATNQNAAIGYWDGSNFRIESGAAQPMLITSYEGNIKLGISGGTTMNITSTSVSAPIFYDSDDTNHYINPNGSVAFSAYQSTLLRRTVPTWTQTAHDIIYNGYATALGDYVYLKAGGNSTTDLGTIVVTDGAGFFIGKSNNATGGVVNSATAPIASVLFRGDNSGNTFATTSSRAPIFYDSNDTNYYVNPNSASKSAHFRGLVEIINETPKLVLNDFDATTTTNQTGWVSFQINGTESGWVGYGSSGTSHLYVYNTNGIIYNYGSYTLHENSSRAPIFYDSNNTAYYVDPNSTSSVVNIAMGGELRLHSHGSTKFYIGGGDAANYTNQNVVLAGWNGLGLYNPTTGGVFPNQTSGFYDFRNGIFDVRGSFRAPIFYDSNNTGYYLNPNGVSVLSRIYSDSLSAGQTVTRPQGGEYTTAASTQTGAIKVTLPHSWTNTMLRMTIKVYQYSTNQSFEVNCGGYTYAGSSNWINPFAYIIGNPGVDRNFNVRFGHDGTKCCIYIGETNSTWAYMQIVVTDVKLGYSYASISDWDDGWDIGFATSFGSVSYAISNSQVGKIADIIYDANDTTYYVNPNSTSYIDTLTATRIGVNPSGSSTNRYGISLYGGYNSGEPTYGLLFTGTSGLGTHGAVTGDWATYFTMNNSTTRGWVFRRVGSANVASISGGGTAHFNGDVVAYSSSDERLKDNKKKIENALEKVESLNGIEFDWNDKQDVYTGHDIGVIAQEVEKIAPEIVANREDGYKAVKYEKLVPLLIEAVKELSEKVKILENK